MDDPPPEPFFTVGLAPLLEPLADLRYVSVADNSGYDSDCSLSVGAGVRLEPQFTKYQPQTLAQVLRFASEPRTAIAAAAWARVLRAIDAADDDAHFANIRAFLDARARDAHSENDSQQSPTAQRSLSRAFQWLPRKSSYPQLRRSEASADGEHSLCPESFELGVESRTVHFNVRLDLHNANLAPPPRPSEFPTASAEDEGESRTQSAPSRRSSLIKRMLDRGSRRRSSQASRSAASSRSWIANHDPGDPAYSEAVDDEEHELPAQVRRMSITSMGRSGTSGTPDLGRVDENAPEAVDILALVRSACAATYGDALELPQGDSDPLPTIIAAAFAHAFGWEGVMHLCYGTGSPVAGDEGAFEQLGRTVDRDAMLREKYAAVFSWRDGVQSALQSDDAPDAPHNGDADETCSLPSRSSFAADVSENFSEGADIAENTFQRSWSDWEEVLTSLVWWTIEYETGRVRGALAHEHGCEEAMKHTPAHAHVHTRAGIAALRSGTVPTPSPAVVHDALNGRYGFARIPGIPTTLRHAAGEYHDFAWARTKLRGSHIRTHLTAAVASLQYLVCQMRLPRVKQSPWELIYLDVCVFDSNIMHTRFPPPGTLAVPPAASYQPASGDLDRRKPCPLPDAAGAWHALQWKAWLGTLHGGDIITPVVSWQAWWTLIATLNGADRTGRWFNLQVKDPSEPYADLQDMSSVYI